MESHVIPFENRWTNGKHAWEWHCELERLGVPTVRTMYCEHETHHRDELAVVFDIPFSQVGEFVYHCHILEHEDGGMMAKIKVVPHPIGGNS